jgi:hypothetical protein
LKNCSLSNSQIALVENKTDSRFELNSFLNFSQDIFRTPAIQNKIGVLNMMMNTYEDKLLQAENVSLMAQRRIDEEIVRRDINSLAIFDEEVMIREPTRLIMQEEEDIEPVGQTTFKETMDFLTKQTFAQTEEGAKSFFARLDTVFEIADIEDEIKDVGVLRSLDSKKEGIIKYFKENRNPQRLTYEQIKRKMYDITHPMEGLGLRKKKATKQSRTRTIKFV